MIADYGGATHRYRWNSEEFFCLIAISDAQFAPLDCKICHHHNKFKPFLTNKIQSKGLLESEQMTNSSVSRVAELLYVADPMCNFFSGISELQAVLTRVCGREAILNWDHSDVAMFDMPGVRILLSLTESPYEGYATRLVISVGPSPITALMDRTTMVHASICVRIVNRLKERSNPNEIRWNDIQGVVTADDIDTLSEEDAIRQKTKANHKMGGSNKTVQTSTQSDLNALRSVLHPYGPNADLPAAWMRVANTSLDLAASLAILPFAAMQYAATRLRSNTH